MIDPDVPDFSGRHGDVDLAFHLLDQLDQVFDLLLAAIDGLVADDDGIDVVVTLRELDRRDHLALVTIDILVDPRADRDLDAGLVRERRHHFRAARR